MSQVDNAGKSADAAFDSVRLKFEQSVRSQLSLELRDVQANAAAHLLHPRIVEMQTGEGKTLTTAMAAAAFAESGRKILVATANEYLAKRDAEWMQPVLGNLGITTDAVTSSSTSSASGGIDGPYYANVTYGTIRQFGFDFLRDGLIKRVGLTASRQRVSTPEFSRDRHRQGFRFDVLIVDEADSVLIDEARMPMIITSSGDSLTPAADALFRWAAEQADSLSLGNDFVNDDSTRSVALLPDARKRLLRAQMPPAMNGLSTTEILHATERALLVKHLFQRDHHYIVQAGRINLVDEYTGRASLRRTMASGLHQALEARERLELTPPTTANARITVQDFVAKFRHVSGLTATAHEDRREFRDAYGLTVYRLPTHQPVRRSLLPSIVCVDRNEKWQRIADEITNLISDRRAVLIGTRTIEQSQSLSMALSERGITHDVLNALNPEEESKIVTSAGQVGRVTVATNMAGRGTDIPLSDEVRSQGGLHVIVSELHASRRIDRQLMGRCARQGDPGTTRLYVSAEDELIELARGTTYAEQVKFKYAQRRSDAALMRKFLRAQKHLSRLYQQQRLQLTQRESHLAEAMRTLGLDPHFDPIPDDCA